MTIISKFPFKLFLVSYLLNFFHVLFLENPFLTVDGDILNFSVPLGEVKLEPDEITDEEREALKEFFDNRPSKTPERYLKIRNYIIEVWYVWSQ